MLETDSKDNKSASEARVLNGYIIENFYFQLDCFEVISFNNIVYIIKLF